MPTGTKNNNWKSYFFICSIIIISITMVAAYTRLWVITAIPIGFLFGFFLKKGELCGASAMSEVILMKDNSKAYGLWIAIVVSMVGFAALDLMDLIKLNPKPFLYFNYTVGGILFGTGIVLTGGCVSGCLFKSGSGNINSMAGLVGIPLGIALIEYGPLKDINLYMKSFALKSSAGGPVTLSSMTGLPFWILAALFLIATLVISALRKKKKTNSKISYDDNRGNFEKIITSPWKPWKAGMAIGILAMFAYLSSAASGRNYPLGVSHGVLHLQMLMTESNLGYVFQKKPAPAKNSIVKSSTSSVTLPDVNKRISPPPKPSKKVNVWLIFLVTSLIVGAWVSARLSGTMQFLPRPPDQTVIAFIGGIILGTGAAIAKGCVIGNILSGWALMSTGTIFFGIVAILSNWATTYFYLMGGKISGR